MRTRIISFCAHLWFVQLFAANLLVAEDLESVARAVRWKHLALASTIPPDLSIDVTYNEGAGKFAEWVYGTPGSARVSVAILPDDAGKIRVYIDRNRNRRIEDNEILGGDQNRKSAQKNSRADSETELFSCKLNAQQTDGDNVIGHVRQVLLKLTTGEDTVAVATASTPLHTVKIEGSSDSKPLSVRQVDVNANGLFADARDQVQIDLNHDGKFSRFLESFPLRPVMNVRGSRWFVKADRFGNRINFASATATGKVRIMAKAASETDMITDLVLTLTGDDGGVYTISDWKTAAEIPVGRYCASVLYCTVRPDDGPEWAFTFSRETQPAAEQLISVEDGRESIIDPIGQLVFRVQLKEFDRKTRQQRLQPQLFTQSGMLINLCETDGTTVWNGPRCVIVVTGPKGAFVGQANSGFA